MDDVNNLIPGEKEIVDQAEADKVEIINKRIALHRRDQMKAEKDAGLQLFYRQSAKLPSPVGLCAMI